MAVGGGTVREIFGRHVRERRKARGLSQEMLAAECGLHRTYVGSIERAERNVSVDNVEKIAAALDEPAWQLLKP